MLGTHKFFGDLRISAITKRHCEDWMADRGKNIAASTFNKDSLVLKSIFEYALRDGLILDNPAQVIKRRKVVGKEIIIPSREQFETLLDAIDKLDGRAGESKALVQLLAFSGMRLGEATRIVWREIDLKKNQFTVSGGEIGTKNGETRIVPLFPRLKTFLQSVYDGSTREPEERVISIESTKTALGSACRQAKLPHFTHYSLRHFFVSNAIEVGVDFKTIASWIGHKDGGILVAQTYGHLRPAHSQDFAALLK